MPRHVVMAHPTSETTYRNWFVPAMYLFGQIFPESESSIEYLHLLEWKHVLIVMLFALISDYGDVVYGIMIFQIFFWILSTTSISYI